LASATQNNAGTTTSTSYTTTLGGTPGTNPSVTVTTGTKVLVTLTGYVEINNDTAYMSFAVSGATTMAAADATALRFATSSAGSGNQASATYVVTLNSGSNTFTLQYKSGSVNHTATFANRNIIVIPVAD